MFRYLSIVVVVGALLHSCKESNDSVPKNNFDVSSYYKDNQNERVLKYLQKANLLVNNQPTEIFFINHSSTTCNSCLDSKYQELEEIFKKTQIRTLIIFNDSTYFKTYKNQNIHFQYCPTKELKSNKLFHSNPWFYSYSNNKLVDRKLTVNVSDSLLKRFDN